MRLFAALLLLSGVSVALAQQADPVSAGEDPGFVGEIAGEVPRYDISAISGPATLSSGLGDTAAFTGAAPMLQGVADMSALFGVCMVSAGFWDDRTQTHINFILTLPSDGAYEPQTYLVGWERGENGIPPGQLLINTLIMWSDPTYEKTKYGAENASVTMSDGFMERILQGFSPIFETDEMGPGRNWTLTANAGSLEITRITADAIQGRMLAYLRGGWVEAERSGTTSYVQLEGEINWQLDDLARQNLASCAGPI